MKLKSIAFLPLLLASAGIASAASIFTEEFSTPDVTQGWSLTSDGDLLFNSLSQGGDALTFGATNQLNAFLSVTAEPGTTGSSFVGDFISAGIGSIEFTLTLNATSNTESMYFQLTDSVSGNSWSYALVVPVPDAPTSFTVNLESAAGWTSVGIGGSLADVLANNDSATIGFNSSTIGDVAGDLAVVSTIAGTPVPEPSALLISLVGLVGFGARRRR